jgi:hypothetical protein
MDDFQKNNFGNEEGRTVLQQIHEGSQHVKLSRLEREKEKIAKSAGMTYSKQEMLDNEQERLVRLCGEQMILQRVHISLDREREQEGLTASKSGLKVSRSSLTDRWRGLTASRMANDAVVERPDPKDLSASVSAPSSRHRGYLN